MKPRVAFCALLALTLSCLSPLLGQTATPLPQAYSFTADPALPIAGPAVVKVFRDGNKELVEQTLPPYAERKTPYVVRLLYDFAAHTLYTRIVSDPAVPCGLSKYTGSEPPFEFDMISGGAVFVKRQMDIAKSPSKQVGTEVVSGITFKILEISIPQQGSARFWVADPGGYPLRIVFTAPDGKKQTYLELKQLSFAKPPASTFAPPSGCVDAGTSSGTTLNADGTSSASASATLAAPETPPTSASAATSTPAGAAAAKPPPKAAPGEIKLQADLATTREIALAWAGAEGKPFRLERKSGQQPWTTVEPAPTGTVARDTKIEPYATYQYRVTAGAKTSNVITVGPPPPGFATIAPRPDKHPDTSFGRFITPALDSNGDPAAAFVYNNPSNDGHFEDSQMMFVSWDRAAYRWKEPVVVATVGRFDPRPPTPGVGLAHDPQTGAFGIAWIDPDNKRVFLALSKDGGVTWTVSPLLTDNRNVSGPSLAFSGGRAFFTLALEGRGTIQYMTGGIDEPPSQWKSSAAPMLPGNNQVLRGSSLALDGAGAPALAYWQKAGNGNLWTLAFWRPGSAQPVKVADTGASTYPPDGVLLAFAGQQPRVVLDARLDRTQISSHYSVFSNDSGATWSQPLAIPDDGNEHIGGYMSFAAAADGRAAFAGDVAGGNTDRMQCSWPKLARTTDLASWTTCAPQGAQYKEVRTLWGSVIYSPSGMLYLLFQNRQTNPAQGLPSGLLIWGGR